MKKIGLMIAVFLLLVCVQQAWAAPSGLPSTFYGCVRFSGSSVPAGSFVSARIGGVTCGREAVLQDAALGTVYVLDVPADDLETPQIEGGRDGDAVVFVVELPGGGTQPMMQVGTWHSGRSMELNLDTSIAAVIPLVISQD